MRKTFWAATAAAVVVAGLGACGGGASRGEPVSPQSRNFTSKPTPKAQVTLGAFASCDAYRDYYAEALTQEYLTAYDSYPCWGCEVGIAVDRGAPEADTALTASEGGAGAAAPSGTSDTNTQEAGVDEADIVEVDPRTGDIYLLSRTSNELLVVDALPAEEMRIIARQSLKSEGFAFPTGMYLDTDNDRLAVVLGGGYYTLAASGGAAASSSFAPSRQQTEILFFDVSDPAAPVQTGSFAIDGFPVGSRRIGDRMHLVVQHAMAHPAALFSDDFYRLLEEYGRAVRAENQTDADRLATEIGQRVGNAVQAAPLLELLPAISRDGGEGQPLDCTAVQRPELTQRLGLVAVTSIDTDGGNEATTAVLNNAWQLYVSPTHIYLLQTSDGWWFDPEQTQQTAVYQLAIGAAAPQPRAAGLVDGWVNNSYSLSEYQGSLRMVTTERRFQGGSGRWTTTNHLFVLNAASGLDVQGQARDFTKGFPNEQIFSARFIGERGFVVTAELIDPLFTFDLSNPAAPRPVGFVEIPGVSTYIHPLGEDHLLTIGRNGDETGFGNSFQLQIFDVSNLADPRQVAVSEPGLADDEYAFSLAEYDPLAFTYYEPRGLGSEGLLSIPVQIGSPRAGRSFSGFFAYRVTTDAISEYARIDHKQQGSGASGCPPSRSDEPVACSSFAPVIYNEPLRTVIIEEGGLAGRSVLYTVSSALLNATDAGLLGPAPISEIPLDSE